MEKSKDLFTELIDNPPVFVLVPVLKFKWYQDKPAKQDGDRHV